MILLYLLAIAAALTIGAILAGLDHDEAARVERAGGTFTRCPECGRLLIYGQTCTCGYHPWRSTC